MAAFDIDAEIDILISLYARSKARICREPVCNSLCWSALPSANPPPPSKFVKKSRPATNKIIDLHIQRQSTDTNACIGGVIDSPNHTNDSDRSVNGSLDFDLLYSQLAIGYPGVLSASADLNSKDI